MSPGAVNPYTFVDFAPDPVREEPAGHDRLASGRLSGAIDVTVTARTPLLIGPLGRQQDREEPDLPRRADGTVVIPGSGFLGALRSGHEALCGSCLRVVDLERVPVHREPARTPQNLTLAVVASVDGNGRPTALLVCEEVVWVESELLARPAPGQRLRSGDRLTVPEEQITNTDRRRLLRRSTGTVPEQIRRTGAASARADGTWVLALSSTAARDPRKKAWFALGKTPVAGGQDVGAENGTGPDRSSPSTIPIPPEVVATFFRTLTGAEGCSLSQMRTRPSQEHLADRPDDQWVDVLWPPPQGRNARRDSRDVVGLRPAPAGYLQVGQPIWVRRDRDGHLLEIKLAVLWRALGTGPVRERLRRAGPCTDERSLCPTCRVFGSAGEDDRGAAQAAGQRGYRGHLRITDLVAEGRVDALPWRLAPLSSPRPSAGQFYLDHSRVPASRSAAGQYAPPAAHWGSCADNNSDGPRPIRGRKAYWRTADPTGGRHPRGRARDHPGHGEGNNLVREVRLVPAGTVFHGRITFENLDVAALGGVLAALDTRLLGPDWSSTVMAVGGGKPFGFGSVTVEAVLAGVETASARYLGSDVPDGPGLPTRAGCVEAFRGSLPAEVLQLWKGLRNASTLGYVRDDAVWYPPGTGEKGTETYDQGFDFWRNTCGVRLKREDRPLVPLPAATASPEQQVVTARNRATGGRR